MKKITLKISAFLLLAMFALQVQGQALWTENGTYKISTSGVTPELYLTINGASGDLEWAAELAGDHPTQVWAVVDHREPASAGYVEITADLSSLGAGDWTMIVDQSTITIDGATGLPDPNDKDFKISVRPGLPVADVNDANYGFDQFQRRKAKVDANGLADPNGANPADGNNAIFVKPTGASGASRYGVVPAAAGEEVLFDGGGIDVIQFHLVESLSTEQFDTSSVFISNPVKDELSIEGLNQNINKISVYDLLGKEVISSTLAGDTTSTQLDVSTLTSGIYIVKMIGENNVSFSKKIIKE